MSTEIRLRSQSQALFTRALSSAWRNGIQLHDPSLWSFRDPEVEEKMLRNADIKSAVSLRRHMIAGKDWGVVPRFENSVRSDLATVVATDLLEHLKHFNTGRKNLARAFFSGARFARIHCAPKVLTIGDGRPRTWKVPVRLEDLDKRMYRIVPALSDEQKLSASWERWDVGRAEFIPETLQDAICTIRHRYEDDQASLGHGTGLREALGWWWYASEHVFGESLQAVERFAQGIIHAKIDGARDAATGLPNTELVDEWRELLENLRARHVLVSDKQDDVGMVPVNGEGWQLMTEFRQELRTTMTTLILGSNLPTTADEGGSYALGQVQQDTQEILVQSDRKDLEDTLTDDLLGCMWFLNWGNLTELSIQNEQPRFSITQEKHQDPTERAATASTLHGMGVALSLSEVMEQTGFTKPEGGEDVIPGGTANPTPLGLFARHHER